MAESCDVSLEHNILYGREDDTRNLINLLLEEKAESSRVAVLTLVGDQGIGKTALARFIYYNPRICKHFERRGWVNTSKDFESVMLVRRILESITRSSWIWAEPSAVRRSLEWELEKKRFLIVLDDFCPESLGCWVSVMASLSCGQMGSKVLLLTRDESAAKASQTMPSYRLKRVSEESCWRLFQKYAFPSHDIQIDEDLRSVGRRISEKCNGKLILVRLLGSTLCSETDINKWKAVCDELDSSNSQSLDLFVFKKFYGSLLPDLQLCLSYCILFPKFYLFDKEQLIRLWTAQGYIKPVNGKRFEETGGEYFNELLKRSIFYSSTQVSTEKRGFMMHHQVLDIASRFSLKKEFCRVEDDEVCSVREKALYQSFVIDQNGAVLELTCPAESTSIQTLLFITKFQSSFRRSCYGDDLVDLSFSSDVINKMKSLRTLDLSYTGIKELPDSIGGLIHLRFLGLNHTKIRTLPQALCNLYNLQTLELHDCSYLLALPIGISALCNLHHLFISKAHSFALLPCGIGKLTGLITLSTFYIGRDCGYYVIKELKNLVNLRGELCISGLSNVTSKDDATAANMKNKEYIERLILEWKSNDTHSESYIVRNMLSDHIEEEDITLLEEDNDVSLPKEEGETVLREAEWMAQIDISCSQVKKPSKERYHKRRIIFELREGVLENLQPHSNLEELAIQNYEGRKLANWMGDSCLWKLVSISLSNCNKCEVLPPLGRLPVLKHLLLQGFHKLKHVGSEVYGHEGGNIKPFCSLEKLELEGMHALEEWRGVDGAFPHLSELSLSYCHRLKTMPLAFPALEKLNLRHCNSLLSLPNAPSMSTINAFHCNQKILSALPEKILNLVSVKTCYDKLVDFTLG